MKPSNNIPTTILKVVNNLFNDDRVKHKALQIEQAEQDLLVVLQHFMEEELTDITPIQRYILKAIVTNTSIMLDEVAMKYLEMAYSLAAEEQVAQ